jgi:hypothetical protein
MYVCMLVTPLCVMLCAVFPCFVLPILVLYLSVSQRVILLVRGYLYIMYSIYILYTAYIVHRHGAYTLTVYLHWSVSLSTRYNSHTRLYWPVLVSSRPFGPFCPFFLLPSFFRPHRPSQLDALRRYSTPTTLHTHPGQEFEHAHYPRPSIHAHARPCPHPHHLNHSLTTLTTTTIHTLSLPPPTPSLSHHPHLFLPPSPSPSLTPIPHHPHTPSPSPFYRPSLSPSIQTGP